MGTRRAQARASSARAFRCLVVIALAAAIVPGASLTASANGAPVSYWVDAVNGSDTNTGTEAEPFKSITHALSVATPLDDLIILPGTYDTANGEVFPLGVDGESLRGLHGPDVTIVHGDGSQSVLIMNNPHADDFLEGLTFQNGGGGPGAGVLVSVANPLTAPDSPRIENNIFADNDADAWSGGGLQINGIGPELVHPLVKGNLFIGNSTVSSGGGLHLYMHVAATVVDNTFIDNNASSGGAINVVTIDAPLLCSGNRFEDNGAQYGGAIYTSLVGSQDQVYEGNGFYSNWASEQGGALWCSSSTVVLSGNDAGNNSSAHDGGFGYLWHTSVEAENNILGASHAVDDGNAWYLYEATLFENNDTVAASFGSDTVAFMSTAYAEFTNCIYDNPDSVSDFINAALVEYCCVSDADVAEPTKNNTLGDGNLVGADPMMIGGDSHDPRLMLGSPCIDAADPVTAAEDDFYGDARPVDGDGDGTALPDMGACERPVAELGEYSGDDRYETAAMIATSSFAEAGTVLLASGQNFPDALSAAGLAGALGAPLLLTRTDAVPAVTLDALEGLGAESVIIIGGTVAVAEPVTQALEDAGYMTDRIAGDDRYATSALVAERIAAESGEAFSRTAFIARGDAFPDALSVSPLAYADASPILLTRPGDLPARITRVIEDLDIEHGAVIGGTAAVADAVKSDVDDLLVANGGEATERWFGADRYATAVDVAENGVDAGIASFGYVGVATGENYPDALAGGVGAGAQSGVVALTATAALSPATKTMLEENAPSVVYLEVFGGPSAVSAAVRTALADALGW